MKTFKLKTFGCKVNQYESQVLYEKLLSAGLKEAKENSADIYIVNSCTVTQRADRKSIEAIRSYNHHNPKARIFVTGCSVKTNESALMSLEGVAAVLENSQKENLIDFIKPNNNTHPKQQLINKFHKHTRAFLKIQDGCNNGCSYCIIPKVRGVSRSRPLDEVIREAKNLVNNGYREIVLCGICLGDYGGDLGLGGGLVKLISSLEDIDALLRIRLSSIEASDVTRQLIDKMLNSKKLCRHLHIPFQSGDDKVLKLMNRKVNSEGYRKLCFSLRRLMPDIGITTDIMVGFPGEDENSFTNTVKFLNEVKPSRIHVFPFSRRKGTLASTFGDKIDAKVVKDRVRQIKLLAKELSLDFYKVHLGKTLDVLIESLPHQKTGSYQGYSDNYIKVFIPQRKNLVGAVVKVKAVKLYQDGVLSDLLP